MNLLGKIFNTDGLGDYQYLAPIVKFLDQIIVPLTIVLAVSAALLSIIIAVALAKAENAEKMQDMKKRLIGLIIFVCVFIVLVWVFGFIISEFGTIMDGIRSIFTFNF